MAVVLEWTMSAKVVRASVWVNSEDKVAAVRDICGEIRVLTEAIDFPHVNIATVEMRRPSTPHYHKKTTEFYYCVRGSGTLVVGGERINFLPGVVVIIPPYKAHYVIPRVFGVKVLVVSSPAWSKDDEFIIDRKKHTAGYSESVEKVVLIQQLLVAIRRGPLAKFSESRRFNTLRKLSIDKLRDLFITAV